MSVPHRNGFSVVRKSARFFQENPGNTKGRTSLHVILTDKIEAVKSILYDQWI